MHTRLVVVSKDVAYPDKIVPSTGTVSDFESSDFLIEDDDATYVMDRGYPSKKNLMDWLEKNISFVVRITKSLVLYSLEEYEPTHPSIKRDAKVNFGISNEPVRYIEFVDGNTMGTVLTVFIGDNVPSRRTVPSVFPSRIWFVIYPIMKVETTPFKKKEGIDDDAQSIRTGKSK
jgi:hypothetical protein